MLSSQTCIICWRILFVLFIGFIVKTKTTPTTIPPPTPIPPGNFTFISLAEYDENVQNGQVFYTNIQLDPSSRYFIQVTDISTAVSFIIVQVHSYENNLTLSYNDPIPDSTSRSSINGSNIGLDLYVNGRSYARLSVWNDNNATLDALVAVVAYGDKAPTPGGCNLEFDIEISPFQQLTFNDATITTDCQPASAPRENGRTLPCDQHRVHVDAYRMFLPERDFSSETYFDGILKMMSVQSIMENGEKIRPAIGSTPLRRVYSAYPGTGSVYAAVATYKNFSAAYVPITTYACDPRTSPTSCNDLSLLHKILITRSSTYSNIAKAICAIVLIGGFLITFIGHRFFILEVVFLGAISSGIISFCILSFGHMETSTTLGIVLGFSFLCVIAWLKLSSCMGMAGVVTILSSMTLGFFIASTVYFGKAEDTSLFESDVNFWLIYVGVTLLVPVVLAVLPVNSNAVSCAILGSYCIILPIDYYAGSNLKYIVINTVRRVTVKGFNIAAIQPPYQDTDKCLTAFMVVIALFRIWSLVCYFVCSCCCCCKRRREYSRDTATLVSANNVVNRRYYGI